MRAKFHLAWLTGVLFAGAALAQPSTTPPAPAPGGPKPIPGSGPSSGPGVPAQPPKPVNTKPIQLSPKEMEQLKDIEAEHDRFVKAGNEHDTRMRTIAKREYDQRVADLQKRYSDRIAKTLADKGKRHDETIALLEKFLKDHPDHDTFTPDAMFRLADLYLDRADDEVEARLAALEQLPQGGPMPPPDPASIVADYSPALNLWEDILKRFPSYRQTPSTLYLLAYYGKNADQRKSLTIFLALACSNHFKWNDTPSKPPDKAEALRRADKKVVRDPYADCQAYPGSDPELIRHAWVRGIADYHFTIPGELDEAIAAYLKVADKGQDSKLYAESLYKLAWSYYKRDFLKEAIDRFDQSVKLYDSVVAQGGQPALELRDESIQYISVAFTDPWEGETNTNPVTALDRAKNYYKGRENEPHVRDVWVAMGKAFTDIQAWDQGIESYRIAIGPPWELNPKNPIVHQEIVNIFEAKGDKAGADHAAAELATKYAPGTAWYAANEKDRDAMENQRRIAERMLYAAARNTHSLATQERKDWENSKGKLGSKEEWMGNYSRAVELYRTFLQTYPDSDYVYEFNYNTAEALYYSEHFLEAAEAYKWVRDHRDLGTAFYTDAARSVVLSYQAEADRQVAAGKLAALKIPSIDEMKALPQPFQAQPIPDVYLKLQSEYDNFQNIVNDPAEAPKQGTNAALISLAYLHVDDAISRFSKVMDKFCQDPFAVKAKDGMLAIFEAQKKFDAIEATNKRFITANCGDVASRDNARKQNNSLNFSRANELFDHKEFTKAGDAYYTFYKNTPPPVPPKDPKAPKEADDRPVALYNAALAYKLADRPNTAISLFKEFTDNKDPAYRGSSFYLDALGNQAATYQAKFDYNNAITTYLDVYATAKAAKAKGIAAPKPAPGEKQRTLDEIAVDALYRAAFAAELNRDFNKAVELYTQYQGVEPDRKKKDRAMWSVIGIYRQRGDVNSMSEEQQRWRARYGNDAGNEDDFVQTFYDEAALRAKKGQGGLADQLGVQVIDAWKKKGSRPNTPGAKMAGEWQLKFAEDSYAKTWTPYEQKQTSNDPKQLKALADQVVAQRTAIEKKYAELDQYGVVEYSMANRVRFGDIQVDYGLKVQNMPIPPLLNQPQNAQALATFLQSRDDNLAKLSEAAKQQWIQVLDAAKSAPGGSLSNKWVRLAQEDLGREFPAEFTPLRQEIIQGTDAP